MDNDERELADFQAALLNLLDQDLSAKEMLERMKTGREFAPFRKDIEQFDLRAIEVAAEVTKKWGKKGNGYE